MAYDLKGGGAQTSPALEDQELQPATVNRTAIPNPGGGFLLFVAAVVALVIFAFAQGGRR
jgi:hypothetical protein